MASEAERLNIVFAARDREFQRITDRVMAKLNRLQGNVNYNSRKINSNLARMQSRMAAFAKVGITVGLLNLFRPGGAMGRAVEVLDDIGKQADALGVTTQYLQAMRYAAEGAGVQVEHFDKALKKFNQALGDADSGLMTQKRAFDSLGVSIYDANGNIRETPALFREAASGLAKLGSEAKKQQALRDLFGRQGYRMQVFLRGGAEGVDAQMQNVIAFGAVIDDHIIRKAEEVQTAYDLSMRRVGANMATTAALVKHKWADMAVTVTDVFRRSMDGLLDTDEKTSLTLVERREKLKQRLLDLSAVSAVDVSGPMDKTRKELEEINAELASREALTANRERAEAQKSLNEMLAISLDQLEREAQLIGATTAEKKLALYADKLGLEQGSKGLADLKSRIDHLQYLKDAEADRAANERAAAAIRERNMTKEAKLLRAQTRAQELYMEGYLTAAEMQAEIARLTVQNNDIIERETERTVSIIEDMNSTLESRFETVFMDLHNIVQDGSDGLKRMFSGLVSAILEEFTRIMIARPLAQALAGAMGGMFGGFFGMGGATPGGAGRTGMTPANAYADGGYASAGRSYLVGERGPEIFTPGRSGQVHSNADSMRMTGGGGVRITQNIHFQVGVQDSIRAEIQSHIPQIAEVSKAAVMDAQRKGSL